MRDNGSGILLYVLMILLAVTLAVLVFLNYGLNAAQQKEIEAAELAAATTPTPPPTATPEPTPEPKRNTETVTLAFSGDIVGQSGLTTDAQVKTETTNDAGDTVQTVSYSYDRILSGAAAGVSDADVAACTLVSTLSNAGQYDNYRMDGALASALVGAGYDLVNLGTDRILDYGLDGLQETANILSGQSLVTVGATGSELSDGVFMADVNGIRIAFLSYTYGTNGNSAANYPWCIDILTTDYMSGQEEVDYQRIEGDIAVAEEQGCDIVVCFLYWWDNTQYYTQPRDNQTEVVDTLLSDGVDIIIGGGVKTPQPMELRRVERPDGTTANCVVCYSLSSLMSCFNDNYTNISATARVSLMRDVDSGEVWIGGLSYDPLFMLDTDDHEGYSEPGFKYRLLDAYSAMDAYDNGDTSVLTEAAYNAVQTAVTDLRSILGAEYDSRNGGAEAGYPN